jgi:AcrR family transcriptional regulator
MVKPSAEVRMSRETWVDAALAAIAETGLEGVAVEPIAERLGVTKGSFYWHFSNRAELLEAALHRWEEFATAAVIHTLSAVPDARERLRLLLHTALGSQTELRSEHVIFTGIDDPVVRGAVDRVNTERLEFLATIFTDLGFGRSAAQRRARIAYALYLGHMTLGPTDDRPVAIRRYVNELLVVLTAK